MSLLLSYLLFSLQIAILNLRTCHVESYIKTDTFGFQRKILRISFICKRPKKIITGHKTCQPPYWKSKEELPTPAYFAVNLSARCTLGLLEEFPAYSISSVSVKKVDVLCNFFLGMAPFMDEICSARYKNPVIPKAFTALCKFVFG